MISFLFFNALISSSLSSDCDSESLPWFIADNIGMISSVIALVLVFLMSKSPSFFIHLFCNALPTPILAVSPIYTYTRIYYTISFI